MSSIHHVRETESTSSLINFTDLDHLTDLAQNNYPYGAIVSKLSTNQNSNHGLHKELDSNYLKSLVRPTFHGNVCTFVIDKFNFAYDAFLIQIITQ